MTQHPAHFETVVVVHRTYARFPHEHDDDLATACAHCLAVMGVVVDPTTEDRLTTANATWSAERFPWREDAQPGDVGYRPSDTYAPSLDEILAVHAEEARR